MSHFQMSALKSAAVVSLVSIGVFTAGCKGSQRPNPGPPPAAGTTCRSVDELTAQGEVVVVPSFSKAPKLPDEQMWSGENLPASFPDARQYVRCRPCDCGTEAQLQPWDDWYDINLAAYVKLRGARAPYSVAIIPGFHGGGEVAEYRLQIALQLLRKRWVAALLFSGGHRRGGYNEARHMYDKAHRMAAEMGFDIKNRVFVEPCAATTLTNLRNSLRMLGAWGIERALLLTDSKMTGQAMVFYDHLEALVQDKLQCSVGRVSYLLGDGPVPRVAGLGNGCQPTLSGRNNPLGFLLPNRRPTVFWVSPGMEPGDPSKGAVQCIGGSADVTELEPDDESATSGPCLPVAGEQGLACVGRPVGLQGTIRDGAQKLRDLFPSD